MTASDRLLRPHAPGLANTADFRKTEAAGGAQGLSTLH